MADKGSCKAENCAKPVVGRGYCSGHFRKWKQGALPKARYKTCVEAGCHGRQVAKARCATHAKIAPAPGSEAAPAAG